MATKKLPCASFSFFSSHRSVPFRELSYPGRCLHASSPKDAIAHPITAHGPPPNPPLPATSQYGDRVDRKRRQAEMLKQGRELRANLQPKKGPLKKRFWKDVHIKDVPGRCNGNLGVIYANLCRGVSYLLRFSASTDAIQSYPHHPIKQATSRFCHRPRMGSPHLRPASAETISHTFDVYHGAGRGYFGTREERRYENKRRCN